MASLARTAVRPALASSGSVAPVLVRTAGFHASATQLSTLRELEHRIKSVKNIEKITKVGVRATRARGRGGRAVGRRAGSVRLRNARL